MAYYCGQSPCMGQRMRGACSEHPMFGGSFPMFGAQDFLLQMLGAHGQQRQCPRAYQQQPTEWKKAVKFPPFFTAEDFTVRCEERVLIIEAAREVKSELGSERRQVVRRVEVPEDVDVASVKTLWQRGTLMVVGKKKMEESAEERRQPFGNVDPAHLQMQLDSALKDIFGAKEEQKPEEKPSGASADANPPRNDRAPFGDPANLLHNFLGVDPNMMEEQAKSFMEDMQEIFAAKPTSSDSEKKEEAKDFTEDQTMEDHEAEMPKTTEGPEVTKNEEQMNSDEQKMNSEKLKINSEEASDDDWVKTDHEEVADITESIVQKDHATAENERTLLVSVEEPTEDQPQENTEEKMEEEILPVSEPQLHQVRVDVTGYRPDEVVVATQGHKVRVSANHVAEIEGEGEEEYSFKRTMMMPETVDMDKLDWQVEDNVLVISVPLK